MLAYCIYIVSAAVFLAAGTDGLRLCDGDCMTNTELDICMSPEDDDPRQPIRLLGLFPCNTALFRGRGLNPAAYMAINQINKDTSLLPGFRLELIANNSMVSYVCVPFECIVFLQLLVYSKLNCPRVNPVVYNLIAILLIIACYS